MSKVKTRAEIMNELREWLIFHTPNDDGYHTKEVLYNYLYLKTVFNYQ